MISAIMLVMLCDNLENFAIDTLHLANNMIRGGSSTILLVEYYQNIKKI